MEFKGQYLTYDEYSDLDGTLDKVPFDLLEYNARKMIDERTFGRLMNVKEIPIDVKMCIFNMIEIKNRYLSLKSQNKAIASENTDGYSISYRKQEVSDIEAENKELSDVMKNYLANVVVNDVPILYLGVE